MQKYPIGLVDRLVSAITYLTMGVGGIVYCIFAHIKKFPMSYFVRFNIFQSILISLLYFCFALGLELILKFLSYIPGVNYLVAQIVFLLNKPFLGEYSFIQSCIFGLVLYLTMISLIGKYPRIYGLSKLVDRQAR